MKLIIFLGMDSTEVSLVRVQKLLRSEKIHLSAATWACEMPSKANSGPNKFAG